MSQERFVIDLRALARDGRSVQAKVPVKSLGRLVESLLEPVGEVAFEFQGERDDEGKLYVDLQIQGDLVLQCQRCLEALVWPCRVSNRLLLLRPGEALPEDELENDEVDALEAEPHTDLLALVEDELILAVPLVPRHENCEPPVKTGVDEEISPFAVLRQLRGKV
ncbi:YceD family protein [Zoogloea sp.]|uniref:YceD family protein n=1 Tax=Zoogloea sp. TaxID=49181 RepID=UPI00261AD4C1|nr:YceD family protein [Zoogloea sp.]MDD3354103.1 YceD family protein [Zoogloea sp.]